MKTIEEFFNFTNEDMWADLHHNISFVFYSEISDIPEEFNLKVDKTFTYFDCEIRTNQNQTYNEHFFGLKANNDKILLKIENDIFEVIVKENTLIELRGKKSLELMRNIMM